MRLVLHLKSDADLSRSEFERKYRSALHGLIHSCLSNSIFATARSVHESKKPSLFTFSGLSGKFQQNGNIISGNTYKLSISSPSGPLFFTLVTYFKSLFISKSLLNLGDCSFQIVGISEFNLSLHSDDVIVSDGPIVLTASENERKKFILMKGNESNKNNLIDSDLFLKLFKINLKHKSKLLNLKIHDKIDNLSLPHCNCDTHENNPKFTSTVRMQIKSEKSDYFVVGNRISMQIPFKSESEICEFEKLMDCGFGVMNSYGFGFMKKVLKHD